jgi:hypothetical protein
MLLGAGSPVLAAEFIVPCPRWALGDSWETRSFVEHQFESPSAFDQVVTVTSLVKSREGNKIVVSEKRATQIEWVDKRVHRGGSPPPRIMSSELLYEVVGKNVFLRQQAGDMMSMAFDPAMPVCGAIPEKATYRVKGVVVGNGNDAEGSVTFRMLGKETVTVPAGSFETTVFEAQQEAKMDPSSSGGGSSGGPVVRSYVAEEVGVVKTVIMSTLQMPVVPSAPSSDAEVTRRQGLEKQAKGEDVSAAMAKMQSLSGSGSPQFEQVKTESATELVAYRKAN